MLMPMTAALLAAADTPDIPAAPVIALMAFAVIITIGGHLYGSRTTVATGIIILFLATAGMVVGGYLAYTGGDEDIRDEKPASEPGF